MSVVLSQFVDGGVRTDGDVDHTGYNGRITVGDFTSRLQEIFGVDKMSMSSGNYTFWLCAFQIRLPMSRKPKNPRFRISAVTVVNEGLKSFAAFVSFTRNM